MTFYFWGYDDGIIADDDGVLACEVCPCETGTGTVASQCEYCDSGETPYQVAIVVPAIGSGSCLDCGSLAGTYVVTQYETISSCWWRGVFSNPTTCTGFGGLLNQLLINFWLATGDSSVNAELYFASSGGGSTLVGTWKWTPSGSEGLASCLFDGFVIPPIANGVCSPLTGPDNLEVTAV